jgi:hypothetical protein
MSNPKRLTNETKFVTPCHGLIKDRISVVFVEKGNLDVLDGAFVVVDKTGVFPGD